MCRTEQDMQGSPLQDRTRQRRTVHESAGQNKTVEDSPFQDRTGYAGQPIAGQNKTVEDIA